MHLQIMTQYINKQNISFVKTIYIVTLYIYIVKEKKESANSSETRKSHIFSSYLTSLRFIYL